MRIGAIGSHMLWVGQRTQLAGVGGSAWPRFWVGPFWGGLPARAPGLGKFVIDGTLAG